MEVEVAVEKVVVQPTHAGDQDGGRGGGEGSGLRLSVQINVILYKILQALKLFLKS